MIGNKERLFTILLKRMSLWLFLLLKSPPVNQTQMHQGSLEYCMHKKSVF